MLLKAEKFLLSKKLYAINQETLHATPLPGNGYKNIYSMKAIWFTKLPHAPRNIHYGELQSFALTDWTTQQFMNQAIISKGIPLLTWNGNEFIAQPRFETSEETETLLKKLYKNNTELPKPWEGWFLLSPKKILPAENN